MKHEKLERFIAQWTNNICSSKTKKWLLLIPFITLFLPTSYALGAIKEYIIDHHKRLEIPLSHEGINRLEVEKDRILKVIGQEEEYHIEGDFVKGYVFISPKLPIGERSTVTLITEKGLVQDISFKINKSEPMTIIFKQKAEEKKPTRNQENTFEAEVTVALKDIIIGNTRDYTLRTINESEIEHMLWDINKITEYSNKILKIRKYEYLEQPSDLVLAAISQNFSNSLAISNYHNSVYIVERI